MRLCASREGALALRKIAGSFATAEGRGCAEPTAQRWIPERKGDADEGKLQNADQGAAIAKIRIKIKIARDIAAAAAAAALRAKVSKFQPHTQNLDRRRVRQRLLCPKLRHHGGGKRFLRCVRTKQPQSNLHECAGVSEGKGWQYVLLLWLKASD
jgi:hypothetical protein